MTAIAAEAEPPKANGTNGVKAAGKEESREGAKAKKDKKRKSVGGDEATAEVRREPRVVSRWRPDVFVCA